MSSVDDIKNQAQFKYYKSRENVSFLRATFTEKGYEHSIIILLPDDMMRLVEQRIFESDLAAQAYEAEHLVETPVQIVTSDPRAASKRTVEDKSGTAIVTAKTPQQLEKEAEDEIDRLANPQ